MVYGFSLGNYGLMHITNSNFWFFSGLARQNWAGKCWGEINVISGLFGARNVFVKDGNAMEMEMIERRQAYGELLSSW